MAPPPGSVPVPMPVLVLVPVRVPVPVPVPVPVLVPVLVLVLVLALGACGDSRELVPDASPPARDASSGDRDAGTCATGLRSWPLEEATFDGDSPPFPRGVTTDGGGLPAFLWGTATSAHQVEGGNAHSDWAHWEAMPSHITGGARSDDGPDEWDHYAEDVELMREDGMTAYRFGIEWAKIFPTRAQFDALSPDPGAVAHYHALLGALRAAGIHPMVTLHHFTSPEWWVDVDAPAAARATMGFAGEHAVEDFERWAAWAGQEFGSEVDLWITINEPLVLLQGGYVAGIFPPGLAYDEPLFLRALAGEIRAHAAAYDALVASDRADADGDGRATLVSIAHAMRPLVGLDPCSLRDARAAEQLGHVTNDLFLDAIVRGDLDANADGDLDDPGDRRADASLAGRADFVGVNYYSVSLVTGRIPLGPVLPGVPVIADAPTDLPKTDVGWDVYPMGFRWVLERAARYGLPIYVTENGVADAADVIRPRFVAEHLAVLARAIADGIDVRGYFHWSLIDNFEWVSGFCPRFGLYRVDYDDPSRTRSGGAGVAVYRAIVQAGHVSADLLGLLPPYGAPTRCEMLGL